MKIRNKFIVAPIAFLFLIMISLLSSCASMSSLSDKASSTLQPSERQTEASQFGSYAEIESAFKKISPYKTTSNDLKALRLDPQTIPNVTFLDKIAVRNLLLGGNSSMKIEDLPEGMQDCLKDLDECQGFSFKQSDIKTKGKGSVILRIFKFKKEDVTHGWQVEGWIFLKKDLVVYTLWHGEPAINKRNFQKKPLGPLEDIFGSSPRVAADKIIK